MTPQTTKTALHHNTLHSTVWHSTAISADDNLQGPCTWGQRHSLEICTCSSFPSHNQLRPIHSWKVRWTDKGDFHYQCLVCSTKHQKGCRKILGREHGWSLIHPSTSNHCQNLFEKKKKQHQESKSTVKPRYSAFQGTGQNYVLYRGFNYYQHTVWLFTSATKEYLGSLMS